MSEKEKMLKGLVYDANGDPGLIAERRSCQDLCYRFNQLLPSDVDGQRELLGQIMGNIGGRISVTAPFYCDYGKNIAVGDNFYANHNCIFLDAARITIGNNVYLGPGCCLTTSGHPLDKEKRAAGLEYALPIAIADDVWLGAGVTVLPGVKIGAGSVIGAGSLVSRDIPEGVVAAGVPCRPLRKIAEPGSRDCRARYL